MQEVPSPPRWPILGNARQFMLHPPYSTLNSLAEKFDGIFDLEFAAGGFYVAYKHSLVAELLDTDRFSKVVDSALLEIRKLSGDGLFTAHTNEENWSIANRILTPAFSMKNMHDYIPVMQSCAQELLDKWHKCAGELLQVSDDMTRYTLETIGRCGFGFSFQSFQGTDIHPFVSAMSRSLRYSIKRGQMSRIIQSLTVRSNSQFRKDCEYMNRVVDSVITQRRIEPPDENRNDLLSRMLYGSDRNTGKTLDVSNIRFQLITFLIAGHETTSGLLSFALYLLSKHPNVMQKAQEEVDSVLGGDINAVMTAGNIAKFRYLGQILKETLRLYPTAPGFFVQSNKDEELGATYRLKAKRSILILLHHLHRDPEIWGGNANSFDPERFRPELFSQIPSTAFRPFGNGKRSCIGQNFAMVEATLLLALIIQQFDIFDSENYQLKIEETMTIKPANFTLKAIPRKSVFNTNRKSM